MIGHAAGGRPGRMLRFLLPLVLAACSPTAEDPTALTPDEDRQLNQAAAELDVNMTGNLAP